MSYCLIFHSTLFCSTLFSEFRLQTKIFKHNKLSSCGAKDNGVHSEEDIIIA